MMLHITIVAPGMRRTGRVPHLVAHDLKKKATRLVSSRGRPAGAVAVQVFLLGSDGSGISNLPGTNTFCLAVITDPGRNDFGESLDTGSANRRLRCG